MHINLRPHAKPKRVLISGLATIILGAYRYLDLWGNLSFLVEQIQSGTLRQILGFLASEQGANIMLFAALTAFVFTLLFEVRRSEPIKELPGEGASKALTKEDGARLDEKPFYEIPEYDLTPRAVQPVVTQSPKASIDIAAERTIPKPQPNLVCLRAQCVRIHSLNGDDGSRIEHEGSMSDTYKANAAVAEFENEINKEGGATPVTNLRARISYYDADGNIHLRVNNGFWLRERSASIDIEVGNTAKLILAYQYTHSINNKMLVSYDAVENYNDKPELYKMGNPLKLVAPISSEVGIGSQFRAQVSLIAGDHNELIRTYNFELTLGSTFTVEYKPDKAAFMLPQS